MKAMRSAFRGFFKHSVKHRHLLPPGAIKARKKISAAQMEKADEPKNDNRCYRHWLKDIKYKRNFYICVSRTGVGFFDQDPAREGARFLSIKMSVPDRQTGETTYIRSGDRIFYPDKIDEKIFVNFVHSIIQEMEMHEMNEQFYYKGDRIFDPHRPKVGSLL